MTARASQSVTIVAALLVLGAGCSQHEQPRLYQLSGYIVKLDPDTNLASIHNDRIEGWMEPMTMDYPVVNKNEYLSLHKGEKITATVHVTSEGYWLTNVKEKQGD